MRHVIPQEFNQSDKIGPLTMPQAAVLGIGAVVFTVIVLTSNFWVSILSFFPIAILTGLFMFVRINKIPLYEFLLVYLIYIGTPKLLIYRSDNLRGDGEFDDELEFVESSQKENKPKDSGSRPQTNKSKKVMENKQTPKAKTKKPIPNRKDVKK